MPGDPHPRSAHRASPVSGLASLTPQSLVRQAQAGQARARQAIIRQALARRYRSGRPPTGPTRDHQTPPRQGRDRPPQPSWDAEAPARRGSDPDGPARRGGDPGWDAEPLSRQRGESRPLPWQATDPRPLPGQVSDLPTLPGQVSDLPTLPGQVTDLSMLPGQVTGLRTLPRQAGERTVPRQARDRHTVGQQTTDRLAAVWQAAKLHVAQFQTVDTRLPGHTAPDRAAAPQHRAAPNPGGQRHAAQRWAPREPQQALQTLMRGLAGLIVLAIVGLSTFFIIAEESRGPGRESAAPPGAEPGIASRAVDPEPLTQGEVFPEPVIAGGYQVTMTHSDSTCRIATSGELGALLENHGCDQVVRARLTAPYSGYQVTAGIFNLADQSDAARISELTGPLVENARGTFTTYGGLGGDPLAEPLAQVGWHHRGHYLLYCVVARPDGQLVTDDDPYAARITAELVQHYLGDQIIAQRTARP